MTMVCDEFVIFQVTLDTMFDNGGFEILIIESMASSNPSTSLNCPSETSL
jgi:hypothetical protein